MYKPQLALRLFLMKNNSSLGAWFNLAYAKFFFMSCILNNFTCDLEGDIVWVKHDWFLVLQLNIVF